MKVQHCEPAGQQSFTQRQGRVVYHGHITHIQSGQTHTLKDTHTLCRNTMNTDNDISNMTKGKKEGEWERMHEEQELHHLLSNTQACQKKSGEGGVEEL